MNKTEAVIYMMEKKGNKIKSRGGSSFSWDFDRCRVMSDKYNQVSTKFTTQAIYEPLIKREIVEKFTVEALHHGEYQQCISFFNMREAKDLIRSNVVDGTYRIHKTYEVKNANTK